MPPFSDVLPAGALGDCWLAKVSTRSFPWIIQPPHSSANNQIGEALPKNHQATMSTATCMNGLPCFDGGPTLFPKMLRTAAHASSSSKELP